jgi:hypothetical protein
MYHSTRLVSLLLFANLHQCPYRFGVDSSLDLSLSTSMSEGERQKRIVSDKQRWDPKERTRGRQLGEIHFNFFSLVLVVVADVVMDIERAMITM